MTVAFASRLFALLALGSVGLSVAVTASSDLRHRLAPAATGLAWLIATTATAGSLYYSEVVGFEPCRLCWYQRIAMYPLVIVLAVAAATRDRGAWRYAVPLATVGLSLSGYHYLVQQVPSLGPTSCSTTAPCTAAYVWEFGFISIPFMAGAGFVAIVSLLLSTRRSQP